MGPLSYMRSVVDRCVVKRRMTVMSLDNFIPDSLQCNRGVSSETPTKDEDETRCLFLSWSQTGSTARYTTFPVQTMR